MFRWAVVCLPCARLIYSQTDRLRPCGGGGNTRQPPMNEYPTLPTQRLPMYILKRKQKASNAINKTQSAQKNATSRPRQQEMGECEGGNQWGWEKAFANDDVWLSGCLAVWLVVTTYHMYLHDRWTHPNMILYCFLPYHIPVAHSWLPINTCTQMQ